MSLINDMLRDLDTRRARVTAGSLAAFPVASGGGGGLHRRIGWLLAGLVMAPLIAIAVPLITDHLDLFDWDKPGGSVVTAEISLPPAVIHRPAHRERRTQMRSGSRPQPDTTGVPAAPVTEPARAAHTAITAMTPAEPENSQPSRQLDGDIVVQRHAAGQAYRLAASMAAAGEVQAAIAQLQEILAQEDGHHPARLLLARLYARQQLHDNAEALLQQGLGRFPLHAPYAHLLARLLLTVGRHAEAITYLEAALPGASRDAGYHGLLAGLYRHAGKPARAVKHYTIALALSPDHGEWWMGLGIVQEQLGDHGRAYSAFSRAMEFRLETALRDYISERLQQLSRSAPAGATNIKPTG